MSEEQTTDPRMKAVIDHFNDWHGAAPEGHEIAALLSAIDAVDPLRQTADAMFSHDP